MPIDLHIHTTASDGLLSPEQIINKAVNAGLEVIAITDHDAVEGFTQAQIQNQRLGTPLHLIPGIELNTTWQEEIHLLGYGIDVENKHLAGFLFALEEARRERLKKMLLKLEAMGKPITMDFNFLNNLGNPGRMHVARALVTEGYVSSVEEAFKLYLNRGKPAYVERLRLSPQKGIKLIQDAGGIAVLAHPGNSTNYVRNIKFLKSLGLNGLEVFHPNHNLVVQKHLLEIADREMFFVTGGSDYHGDSKEGAVNIGLIHLPRNYWSHLQKILAN